MTFMGSGSRYEVVLQPEDHVNSIFIGFPATIRLLHWVWATDLDGVAAPIKAYATWVTKIASLFWPSTEHINTIIHILLEELRTTITHVHVFTRCSTTTIESIRLYVSN